MVKYVRIGASRMYVPAAFERLVTAARIAFIRDEDQADPGTEIDVLGLLHRGAVVVYPTVTEAVASSLHSNLPRLLDEATLPGQRIRLAFLTASGGLRAGDTLSTDGAGAVVESPAFHVGDPAESNDTSWRLKIPARASIGARGGAMVVDLSASDPDEGGMIVNGVRAPISVANRQVRVDLEGNARGTLRFGLELGDELLEHFGVGPRYFAQDSFDGGTLYTAASTYPLYWLGEEKRIFSCQLDIAAPHESEQLPGALDAGETGVRIPRSILLPPAEALRTNLHAVHGADVHLRAESSDDAPAGFALTSSPKAIATVGGTNTAFIRSHYFCPIGSFSVATDGAQQQRLSLGLSNLETMAVQPAVDKLTFVPGHAAYDARVNALTATANGASGPALIDLEGLCLTSWVRLDVGDAAVSPTPLSIQPEGMQTYSATGGDAAAMSFSPARFPSPAEPFPLAPVLGVRGETSAQRLRLESDVVAKERRARIAQGGAFRPQADAADAPTVTARTPQGFITVRSPDGATWSKLLFTRTSKRQDAKGDWDELGDVGLAVGGAESGALMSEAMSRNRLMLVTTWNRLKELEFDLGSFGRMHIGGWGVQLSSFEKGHDPIVVLKYDGRPMRQLAREPDQWTAPEQFDPTGKLQERLLRTLDRAKADDDLFGKLARRIDDPNWNGLLVLDAKLPLAGIPEAMKAIGAGLPPALEVPYLGLDVSGIDPDLPEKEPWRSALFGLVHHDEPNPDWEGDTDSRVTMRVPRLILRVENDAIDRFECTVQLRIPRLFDFDSTEPDKILELRGRYESRVSEGKRHDTYIFEAAGSYEKLFGDKSVIRSLALSRLRLLTTRSEGKYTEGRFLIDGDITFNELAGVDLLGIEKLDFTDFAIDLGFFIEGVRNLKLKFNYPNLKFDLDGFNTGSGRRSGSLPGFLRSFPLKLRGLHFGDFDLPRLGFLQLGNLVSTPDFEIGSDFKFALDFDLDLGSLGALAKKLERFKLQILVGWKPIWIDNVFKKNRIAAGFRIDLGEGSGGIDLGLEGILRLRAERFNFKREKVDAKDLIILSADDCRLDVLGNEFPEDGKFSLFLFANLGDPKPWERPGWYASYKDPAARPPIAIEHLVLAQRVDVNLGDVTTTRDALAWLGKQETFDKSDPDAATKFIKFAGKDGIVRYDRNREWFIAFKGDFFEVCRIAVLLKDPDVYGAYVSLLAEDDPSQAVMSFDLLYQKLSDGVGRYVIEVGLPPGYRTIEVGAASVTIGMIRFEIFTDGGFLVDLGFPQHVDYSRSFAVQALIFIGKGGLYLGRTPPVTVPNIPAGYGQVLRAGFAMKIGLGREFEYGPIRAGLSICVFGRIEGYFAASRRDASGHAVARYPYWMRLHGEMGIIAEIEGVVDLRLIRARLLVRVWVATGIVLETALPVLLYCEAGVSVAVEFVIGSFRVFGKRIRITIMLRYSTTLRFEYTLPARVPTFGANAAMLAAYSEKAALSDWIMPADPVRLGVEPAAMGLRLGYDLTRADGGRLVAVPTLMWIEGDGQNAGALPFATLARALIGWAALRGSPDAPTALDVVIRKGSDPAGSSAFTFDEFQRSVRSLDDVPLEQLELLLETVLKDSRIAHVVETGDAAARGYVFPVPFGLRFEREHHGTQDEFDYASLGAIDEQAIAEMLRKFERQFMEIDPRAAGAHAFSAGVEPLVRYVFRSWCAALALAVLDAARTEWKLSAVYEDRPLREVLDKVPEQQWKNAAARAGRLLLSGVRVDDGGASVPLFDRAGLFVDVPAGGKTQLRLLEPSRPKWFTVAASELELDTARVAAMATAAVPIESKTVRPLAVRVLPRRFFLPPALEMRYDGASTMRLTRFSTDLLAQLGTTAFGHLAFSAQDPAMSPVATPAGKGTALRRPRAAMALEIGLQRVVSGRDGAKVVHLPGAFQVVGAREADRLGLDAIMALDSGGIEALKLADAQLYLGWRTGSADDEYVRLLPVPADAREQVLVTRSTVSVQRRPYMELAALAVTPSPEEIFRADFTPQLRFALLYLLQRAAIVNATGTHLILPQALAKPLEEFFDAVAGEGRERIDLMLTFVFADDAKVPAGALNAASFDLPADVQALQRPRVAVVELATVPDVAAPGWREDNMLEAVSLRPAGTELVRTWRHRAEVDRSDVATEAELGQYLAARFDMQEFEVTDAATGKPLIFASDALPQASEEAVPAAYPEQMRGWLTAEKPAEFKNADDLRYDVIVPLSRLLAPDENAPSPYAAVGRLFKVDLGWRDVYGNRLGTGGWSATIEHRYTDPLVGVGAWPCIQSRVFPGAAGSHELVLELAVDESAFPREGDRDVTARELQRILHQLRDPNTSVRGLSSLQPDAVRAIDRDALARFVARLREDLLAGNVPSLPRWQSNFRWDIGTEQPFHAVDFRIALARPKHLVGHVNPDMDSAPIPGALVVESPVRLVASTDAFEGGKESTNQLAAEFQAVFAFEDGGEPRKFWLARGAAQQGESEWWAVDDRVFPAVDKAPPVAYAMPPLARALMSGQVQLRAIDRLAEADTDYLQNTFDASEEKEVIVQAVDRDVDQLMSGFLDRVEAFLSAANAPVTATVPTAPGVDASPFERVAREKARLLDIRGEDPPLLRELGTVFEDEAGTPAALKAARDELREACAQHLQRFYEVGCVVSKSLRPRAPAGWFTATGNDRPKLYGQLEFAGADAGEPTAFRAMTRGVPLEATSAQLAVAVIPESKDLSAQLGPMRYRLTHVERLVTVAEEGRLAPSRWLTIVPLPEQTLPVIDVAAPVVAPFPVRRMPRNPTLERPAVQAYGSEPADIYAQQVALARRWTYGFDVGAEFLGRRKVADTGELLEGDEVCARLVYNAPVSSVPPALETSASPLVPKLFEALVAHEREVEPYWKTIIGEAGRRASNAGAAGADPELRFRNACYRFAESVKNVVDVFGRVAALSTPESVDQDRFVLTHNGLTTRIRFVDHMADDAPWPVLAGEGKPWLRVRQIRADGRWPARTDAVIAELAPLVQADFTFEQDDDNEQWRRRQVDVGRLDALRQQTVWAAASVRRNDKIAGRKARARFVYRTPEVFLQEVISPNILHRRAIRLSPQAPLTLHELLVQGLSPVLDNSGGLERFIQVRVDYESGQLTQLVEAAFGAVTDEPGLGFTPEPDPKLLLTGLRVGAGVGAVDAAKLASTIETLLLDMFRAEAVATRLGGDRGCLVLNVTIRAFEDGKPGLPVLRLERLCLDLRHVTDV